MKSQFTNISNIPNIVDVNSNNIITMKSQFIDFSKESKLSDLVDENYHIFIFYNNSLKKCNVFKYKLDNDDFINKSVFDYFDIFYGNEFSFIDVFKESEINVSFENIVNDFIYKEFVNRSGALNYYNFISKNYKKEEEKTFEKKEIKYSILEYVSIIRQYYHIDTNIENRVRSSELSMKMIDVINNHIAKDNLYVCEDHFISKFSEIASELGLSKKRYSSGNYYYGIREKKVNEKNIINILNESNESNNMNSSYNVDVLKEISRMEEQLNKYKNMLKK